MELGVVNAPDNWDILKGAGLSVEVPSEEEEDSAGIEGMLEEGNELVDSCAEAEDSAGVEDVFEEEVKIMDSDDTSS